jgi:5-methylcytosine-specific restriction endonuclease McrA
MEDANEGEAVATAGFMLSDNDAVSIRAGADAPHQVPPAESPAGFTLSDNEAVSTRAGADVSGQTPPAEPLSPQRYKVQFTAGEEYVMLVEEAQALLSHSAPRATLDEIQLRAMRALVAELKRRKHAVVARAHKPPAESKDAGRSTAERESAQKSEAESESELPPFDAESGQQSEIEIKHPRSDAESRQSQVASEHTRRRGRKVPAVVCRAVFERDEARCTYTDALGQRCAETHRLELHHLKAFALGGEHTEDNLTLRCHAHNALAAEQDFGTQLIERARSASEHEPWAAQPDA